MFIVQRSSHTKMFIVQRSSHTKMLIVKQLNQNFIVIGFFLNVVEHWLERESRYSLSSTVCVIYCNFCSNTSKIKFCELL